MLGWKDEIFAMLTSIIMVLGLILTVVLNLAKIATLIWVFQRTRKWAAIAYLIYITLSWLFETTLVQSIVDRIQRDGTMPWLGETSGEQVTNFLFLIRFGFAGVEMLLFGCCYRL